MIKAMITVIFAGSGHVLVRTDQAGCYRIRIAPDDGAALEMELTGSQLRLLRQHIDELLREAA